VKKRFKDISFQNKIFLTNMSIVLVVVVAITMLMTHNASRMISQSHYANLNLLTEQASYTFSENLSNLRKSLYASSVNSQVAVQMKTLQELGAKNSAYSQQRRDLLVALSTMVGGSSVYDSVSVRLEDGSTYSSQSSFSSIEQAGQTGEQLLSMPQYSQKSYGHIQLLRAENGEVYLLRDVYMVSPLKYVGRMAAHIRQSELIEPDQYDANLKFKVLLFDSENAFLASDGISEEEAREIRSQILNASPETVTTSSETYISSVRIRDGWKTVGLMPLSAVHAVQDANLFTGVAVALLGILIGLISSHTIGHGLTKQVRKLVSSMNRFSAGERNVLLPVESGDDIGVLTSHFNEMTQSVSELMERLVQEEHQKQEAEYQNLEYRYRFLQWQINPHFIYNALETVNALAKLDGNPELSEMITLLSAYFRQNAEAMRMRFITVQAEFDSLRQYVEIYRQIYGDGLNVTFEMAAGAETALVPTMIIQPILENALIHGNAYGAHFPVVHITAEVDNEQLVVCIRDQGKGMSQDTIDRVMGTHAPRASDEKQHTSLGIRNVLDRMHLLYGEKAAMSIESRIDEGTCVRVILPLSYFESDFSMR